MFLDAKLSTAKMSCYTVLCNACLPPTLHFTDPPQLSNGRVIKVDERDGNIPVDIATPPLAYPTPTDFQWTKDGVTIPISSRATFSYPSVLFNSLERSDSGLYSLTATNHRTDNGVAIGTGQGSFTLDVLCEWLYSGVSVSSWLCREG